MIGNTLFPEIRLLLDGNVLGFSLNFIRPFDDTPTQRRSPDTIEAKRSKKGRGKRAAAGGGGKARTGNWVGPEYTGNIEISGNKRGATWKPAGL